MTPAVRQGAVEYPLLLLDYTFCRALLSYCSAFSTILTCSCNFTSLVILVIGRKLNRAAMSESFKLNTFEVVLILC